MLLLIDVGNTNTTFAIYKERDALGQWRLSTNRVRTAAEYAAALIQLMDIKELDYRGVNGVIISSVVPEATRPLRWMSRDFFDCQSFVVGEDGEIPIDNLLNEPTEAGADRLVNAIAATRRYKPPLIIVDFGTATTFDVVNDDGAFIGGIISPGINLSEEALARAAAKLPRIAIQKPDKVIGRSTLGAMQSGMFWGYMSLIEGLVSRIKNEYGKNMTVIGTGGLAPLFAGHSTVFDHVDSDLTMAGLFEIYMHNRSLVRRDKRI